jgi:hypothetical protein
VIEGIRRQAIPALPHPIGPLSGQVLHSLQQPPHAVAACPDLSTVDMDDFHLALYCCYELHYRGFDGCDPDWEWEPSLLGFRRSLETRFENELIREVGRDPVDPATLEAELWKLAAWDAGPSVSKHLMKKASLEQVREFVIHRSAYNLKEADPHSWAIPRLEGRSKAALVEIQADEYGGGREPLMHSTLFRKTMKAMGLDPGYGAYLDRLPGITLATVNLMSLLGLHRRWRGALVGHLALFEMTSTKPNRRYSLALRRLGFGKDATHFFDEHVLADSVHEAVAAHDLAGSLAAEQPELAGDIAFGARALVMLEQRWAGQLLNAWANGASSLRACAAHRVAV